MPESLLQVDNLKMYFPVRSGIFLRQAGWVKAVDDVSFHIYPGETLGLVGESGCGKSTIGKSIVRLLKPTGGSIRFNGNNIARLSQRKMRPLRPHIQMVFQDPAESLNQRQSIGQIVAEPFVIHRMGTPAARREWVRGLLDRVGLPDSAIDRFPFEFSGGQRQRIGIARALTLNPSLIILDEPVSALDVSVQSQVLNLLLELQEERKLSYLFIAHDLSAVKHISNRIGVMYLGRMVELADSYELITRPLHPYTKSLISAIPIADPKAAKASERIVLEGDVPSPLNPPSGCRFRTRCPYADEQCAQECPEWKELEKGHFAACHHIDKCN
ncbi:oligopeptide/dipeptide ABC transporter ATP-binding protein [uncultured Akkermansia sp.]|uniref:ABC transporter ATP-binding protein n=1 Tax=uncultured Akkermansia sp. TaxID=512294 RepID=UPI0031F2F92D